jgi:hypothetical protein
VDDLADPAEGIDEQLGAGHGGCCALPGAPPGSGGVLRLTTTGGPRLRR